MAGVIITTCQGIGEILDDTQFYVVDVSASANTCQYAARGGVLGNNSRSDTAPRGMATTVSFPIRN